MSEEITIWFSHTSLEIGDIYWEMAEVAKSLDELWENKDYQKTGFFAIFWLWRTHYSFSRSLLYDFDICRILVKVAGPYKKSHFEVVALF